MRSSLTALSVLALAFALADEASANRPQFGGDVRVTNTTPFAVRVRIVQGPRVLRNVRLEPMESVMARVRLGDSKNPNDTDDVDIFARGLEAPIQGETDSWFIPDSLLPDPGETDCFYVEGFLLNFPDSAGITVFPGNCNDDPEDPGDPPGEDPGETPGEGTGSLDRSRDGTVMLASSTGLVLLGLAGFVLGRAPRRRDETDSETV